MKSLKLRDKIITTKLPAFVMGILNATPDSFFSQSRGGIEIAKKMISGSTDIIDIGGESSRPGSEYVTAEEEIKRVIPVIEEIRKISDIPISVDTRKYEVMKAAFEAGADILNDISALEDDERLALFAAETKIPVILMHKRGNPLTMQKNTAYKNVFDEVNDYLKSRVNFAKNSGIAEDKIWLDAGIGFGKNTSDNFQLIRRCGEICDGKYPVLMALSRKTCIGDITGKTTEDRLSGTIAANLIAVQKGASLIRVHDTSEAADSLKILSALS